MHKITLNSPWFEYVKNGTKKYEGRCNWKNATTYKIGDLLEISHHIDKTISPFRVKIVDIIKFNTFEEALKKLDIKDILPGVDSINEGIKIYEKFVSKITQNKYGVLLIKIEHYNLDI